MSSGAEVVLAPLVGVGLVGDDDRDLVEGRPERLRDPGDSAVHEDVEPLVAGARTPIGEAGPAAALDHGARILAAMAPDPAAALEPWAPDLLLAPPPDPARVPEGFVVAADDGSRLHFLDWGGPSRSAGEAGPAAGVLLLPGLLQPASSWSPVARRLASAARVVVADLRGQGLSDAPMTGYDPATLASDAVAVAEGSGLLGGGRVVVAGHGFGAIVAVRDRDGARGAGVPASCSSTAAGSGSR